jgi:Protein of unknown function (DUF3987)
VPQDTPATVTNATAFYQPTLNVDVAFQALGHMRDHHTLVALHPNGGAPTGLELNLSDPNSVQTARAWITSLQGQGRNIYFHANPTRQGLGKKAKKDDIVAGEWVQMDVDPTEGVPYAQGREEARQVVQNLMNGPNPPTLVFDRGNGFYPLWRLDQPMEWSAYDHANQAWNVAHGLKGTFNADRILKLPGTIAYSSDLKINKKNYPPKTQAGIVQVTQAVMSTAYFRQQAEGFTPEKTKGKATRSPNSAVDEVPLTPDLVARVTAMMQADPEFARHMGTGNEDRSAALWGIASKMAFAGFTSNQFATVVAQMSKDALDHVEDQKNYTRALVRAWDAAQAEYQQHRALLPDVPPATNVNGQPTMPQVIEVPWWTDVEPLNVMDRIPAPTLPEACITPALRPLMDLHAPAMGVPREIMFASVIGAATMALDDRVNIAPNATPWRERPCLWIAMIAAASAKKTPAMKLATRPLRRLDRERFADDAQRMAQHDVDVKKHTKDMKRYIDGKLDEQPPAQPPKHPETSRIVFNDATVAKLSDILHHNPRGVGMVRDELAGWLASIDGRGDAAKDRAAYLELYNGGGYMVSRVARGDIYVPNWSASILGGIQPSTLAKALKDVPEDGLLQRFYPMVSHKGAKATNATVDPAHMDAYDQVIRRLATQMMGTVRLSHGAAAILARTWDDVFALIDGDTIPESMANHLSKWEGGIYRWALVMHALECSENETQAIVRPVSEKTAQVVADLHMQYFLPNVFTLYNDVLNASGDAEHIRWIAGFILSRNLETLQLRDLRGYRPWSQRMGDDQKRRILRALEDSGWLKPTEQTFLPRTWSVNGNVYTKFEKIAVSERVRRTAIKAAFHT